MNFVVQLASAREIMAEGFFNDDAPPTVAAVQTVLAQGENRFSIIAGLRREIEQNVAGSLMTLFQLVQLVADVVVRGGIVEIAGNVEERLRKGRPNIFVEGSVFEKLGNRVFHSFAELVV